MSRLCGALMMTACLLVGGPAGRAVHAGPATDFPLNPGNRWEYVHEDGVVDTLEVTGSVVVRGATFTQLTRDSDPPFFLLRCRDGVLRFDSLPDPGQPLAQACLILKEPLEVGQNWTCAMTDPPLAFTVLSKGPLTVPAGHFGSAVKIGYRPASNPIYEGFLWFVPSIGFVAMEEDDGRGELAAFSESDLLEPLVAEGSASDVVARLGFSQPAVPGPTAVPRKDTGLPNVIVSRLPSLLIGLVVAVAVILFFWQMERRSTQIDLDDLPEVQRGQAALAAAMVQEGLYGDAAVILQRMAARNPRWPDLAAQLGKAYLFQGKLKEAVIELKRALALNPQLAAARMDLARAYIKAGESRQAMEEIDTVLAKNAGWADTHYLRGMALAALGNETEAAVAFAEALRINPAFAEAREALAAREVRAERS